MYMTIIFKIFPETTWQIKAKYYVEPSGKTEYEFCLCHKTKIAATPILNRNL